MRSAHTRRRSTSALTRQKNGPKACSRRSTRSSDKDVKSAPAWLHRRAENVAALLLAVMFCAFLIPIGFRYFFSFPVGGTPELTVITGVWPGLWGAGLAM